MRKKNGLNKSKLLLLISKKEDWN